MSPRAACRLEALGFDQVYDYTAGIADWKAAGLPTEGNGDSVQQVLDATRTDIPTCQPGERIVDVKGRTFAADWDECVVLDCEDTVIGRIRGQAWQSTNAVRAEEVMESGPTTVRPDGPLHPLVERMTKRGTKLVLVTDPQGRLLGAVLHAEAERLLAGEPPDHVWTNCDGCPGQRKAMDRPHKTEDRAE